MSDLSKALAEALARPDDRQRTRPVSVSIPEPLIEALQAVVAAGGAPSTSAAVSSAVTTWVRNRLLQAQLEEIYAEHPDLRPTEEGIARTLAGLGLRPAAPEEDGV